jgi:cell division protein FtsB
MARYVPNSEYRTPIQKRAIGSLFCVLFLFYIAFHTVSGERGVFALLRESSKLETLKAELQDIKLQREVLDKKSKKLSNNNLDLDLLDEQARNVLGVAGKDEVVVFLEK